MISVTGKLDGSIGAVAEKPVSTCVARGTLVEQEHGPAPIERVQVGDRLWGYDPVQGTRVLTEVRLIRRGWSDETLLFGGTLRVTSAHPLFAGESWRPAGLVGPDEVLLTRELRRVKAGTPQRLAERIEFFDLTVAAPHCYFAGGFLVHNKDRDYVPQLDDIYYDLWPPPAPAGKVKPQN